MKKQIIFFIVFISTYSFATANTTLPSPKPIQTQVSAQTKTSSIAPTFENCQKIYNKNSEPVFYIILSSISKNNYKIEEIQSRNGLVIFKAYNKEFLANITKIDYKTTLLKITPADNNYNFPYMLLENLFSTIEQDIDKDIYKLN